MAGGGGGWEGILTICRQQDKDFKWQVVRSKMLREPVLREAHLQGDTGFEKTSKRVQVECFWPEMTADWSG